MVQLERRFLNVRNDDNPPGIEQRGFDNVLLDRVGFRLRLPDNREIEAPRNYAELVAGDDGYEPAGRKLMTIIVGETGLSGTAYR